MENISLDCLQYDLPDPATQENECFETNLKDLAAALGRDAEELYNILMRDAVKEWLRRGNKLPVVVVIETIDDISRRSPELAALLKDFIVSCGITYEELGERHGMSRAMAHYHIKRLGECYPWINEYMYLNALSYHTKTSRRLDPCKQRGKASGVGHHRAPRKQD